MSEPTFTPEHDIVESYTDGSGEKILFKAGTPIVWATARELGLVTGDPPVAPKRQPRKIADDADRSE